MSLLFRSGVATERRHIRGTREDVREGIRSPGLTGTERGTADGTDAEEGTGSSGRGKPTERDSGVVACTPSFARHAIGCTVYSVYAC